MDSVVAPPLSSPKALKVMSPAAPAWAMTTLAGGVPHTLSGSSPAISSVTIHPLLPSQAPLQVA
nr:hypothetical protein [Nitrincola lacisaponensis]